MYSVYYKSHFILIEANKELLFLILSAKSFQSNLKSIVLVKESVAHLISFRHCVYS